VNRGTVRTQEMVTNVLRVSWEKAGWNGRRMRKRPFSLAWPGIVLPSEMGENSISIGPAFLYQIKSEFSAVHDHQKSWGQEKPKPTRENTIPAHLGRILRKSHSWCS
jgi:hypothetical protein